jgi:NADH:ubiquinone oxidoreductase subunit E
MLKQFLLNWCHQAPTVRILLKIRNNETTEQLYKLIEENKDNRKTVQSLRRARRGTRT